MSASPKYEFDPLKPPPNPNEVEPAVMEAWRKWSAERHEGWEKSEARRNWKAENDRRIRELIEGQKAERAKVIPLRPPPAAPVVGGPVAPIPLKVLRRAPGMRMPGPIASKAEPEPTGLPFIDFDACQNTPPTRYIVRGLLAEGATSTAYGPPKTLKTTGIVDIGVHLAAGQDWRGYRIKEARGVCYFAFERQMQIRQMLRAYQIRDGFQRLPFRIIPKLIDMLDPRCVDLVVTTIKDAEQRHGLSFGLAAFDTWSKAIAAGGGDEDRAKDQNAAAANLRRIIERLPRLNCLTVGHTGKDVAKGERGSNATQGDRDVGFVFAGSEGVRKMSIEYANELEPGDVTAFEGEKIQVGEDEGEPVYAYIVARRTVAPGHVKRAAKPLTSKETNALRALTVAIRDHGKIRAESMIQRSVTIEQWREAMWKDGTIAKDYSNPRKFFAEVQTGLLAKGKIKMNENYVWLP